MGKAAAINRKLLVLQHVDWERPGRLLLELEEILFVDFHIVEIWKNPSPDITDFDALILLGGPPNVGEENKFLFLREEKRLLQAWLTLNRPCLGFCLGHQLLADVFKAKVGPNFITSVGFIEGHLTHEGRVHPLFKNINTPFSLFKWHSQAIDTPVPRNFNLLATSSECMVEAFSIKGRPDIIGLQCDNHAAHPDDITEWIKNDQNLLCQLPTGKVSSSVLLKQAEQYQEEIKRTFTGLMQNFISLINKQLP